MTGLDKQQTVDKHGIDKVTVWRRSYDVPPPPVDQTSEHFPGNDAKYAKLCKDCMPTTESLATTAARMIPYWQQSIVPELISGKTIIIAVLKTTHALSVSFFHLRDARERERDAS